MKKIITIISITFSVHAFGQAHPNDSIHTNGRDTNTVKKNIINPPFISTFTTYNSNQDRVVIYMADDGNIYFAPPFFCDCYKCKNYKGLKKLK